MSNNLLFKRDYQEFGSRGFMKNPADRALTIAKNVAQLRKKEGISQAELAKRIGVKSQNTIAAIESQKTPTQKSKHLHDIARVLKVSIRDIDPEAEVEETTLVPLPGGDHGDLDIYGTTDCGEGIIVITNEPIDVIKRPPALAKVRRAYGVQSVGTSMIPAVRPGNVVLINPNLVPHRDDLCLFRREEHGEFRGTIKEFVSETADSWRVRRYQPQAKEFLLKKSDWPECHVIVEVKRR